MDAVNPGGRTALVTGADRGIGRAVALRLARGGAMVLVHHRDDPGPAAATVAEIVASGGAATALAADLGTTAGVDALAGGVESALLGACRVPRVDVVVNNAAVLSGVRPGAVTAEHFDHVMAVNARAPLLLVQRLLPYMPDHGRIVNVSTGLTRFANPSEVVHAMSKAALEMITLHLAAYLGPRGITVNTVAPGVTDTGDPALAHPDLHAVLAALSPRGRLADPDEVAAVVEFLCAPHSGVVTGSWVDASGGTLLGRDLDGDPKSAAHQMEDR